MSSSQKNKSLTKDLTNLLNISKRKANLESKEN